VTLGSIILAMIPPGEVNGLAFEAKLIGATLAALAIGLALYWRGARSKAGLPAQIGTAKPS
jgi:hypothetical protein